LARPRTKGLPFFKKDTSFYDDLKIIDLLNEYGPVGCTIYDCILCMIYRNGYYLEIDSDKLALAVIRTIGNKWVKNKSFVIQVVHYCADIGLFDNDLLRQDIITSAGLQRRYSDVTSRNKVDKTQYWLIDENGQLLKNISKKRVIATETQVFVTETPVSTDSIPQESRKKKVESRKKRVDTNSAAFQPPSLTLISSYCKEKSLTVDAERFFNYYEANGWTTASGRPVVNWKAQLQNWQKSEREKSDTSKAKSRPSTFDINELEQFNVFTDWKNHGQK